MRNIRCFCLFEDVYRLLAVRVRPNGLREAYLQVGRLGRTLANALSVNELEEVFFMFFSYNYYFLRAAVFLLFSSYFCKHSAFSFFSTEFFSLSLFNFSISNVPFFYIYFPFANSHQKIYIFLYVLQQKICVVQKKAVLLQSKCVYNTHPDCFTTFFF